MERLGSLTGNQVGTRDPCPTTPSRRCSWHSTCSTTAILPRSRKSHTWSPPWKSPSRTSHIRQSRCRRLEPGLFSGPTGLAGSPSSGHQGIASSVPGPGKSPHLETQAISVSRTWPVPVPRRAGSMCLAGPLNLQWCAKRRCLETFLSKPTGSPRSFALPEALLLSSARPSTSNLEQATRRSRNPQPIVSAYRAILSLNNQGVISLKPQRGAGSSPTSSSP